MAVFALRMASRRCFLTAIAVLALAILLVAMTAASQLRGQKSKKTALSEDQQVALLQRPRRVIQLIVPAPARPASGSVKDTSIDADTLRLQVPS